MSSKGGCRLGTEDEDRLFAKTMYRREETYCSASPLILYTHTRQGQVLCVDDTLR